MKYFVIRQKSSGYLFPTTGRGSTHAEFSRRGIPRLFPRQQDAQCCLNWWLQGTVTCERYGGWDGEYDETIKTHPKPERRTEDYEIIPVDLSL